MGGDIREPELARGVTVAEVKRDIRGKKREALAAFIERRFEERYVDGSADMHGFAKAGLACLMIESFQCLREGRLRTDERLKTDPPQVGRWSPFEQIFLRFFAASPKFKTLETWERRAIADWDGVSAKTKQQSKNRTFYHNVRCGILHQGETYNGWRLRRLDGGNIFAPADLVLDAHALHAAVHGEVVQYARSLSSAPWDGPEWQRFRRRIRQSAKFARDSPEQLIAPPSHAVGGAQ